MRRYGQFNTPPVTLNLLIINAILFMAVAMLPGGRGMWLVEQFSVYFPLSPHFRIHQVFTYMFLHANFTHLFFNMFALWMFGRVVEYDLGSKRFLSYYLICGVGALLIQWGVNWIEINSLVASSNVAAAARVANTPMLGASGAIYGILLAFGMMRPNEIIMLLIPPVPIKAKYFVVIFAILALWMGARGGGSIAHFAHLGGMIWGFLLLVWWKRRGVIHY